MIWKHHYSLLVAAGVSVTILVTRPDFEWWYLLPSVGLWGGGHAIIIRIGRGQLSPETAALKDHLERDRMRHEHKRKMKHSWAGRHTGALVMLFFIVAGGGLWLATYGPEGIREWLGLLGCRC